MIVFLLKSGACLAVFLMFYKLLLENERMHTFKRFYLLTALIVALVIPSITFVEYVEVPPTSNLGIAPASIAPAEDGFLETAMSARKDTGVHEAKEGQVNHWPVVLWTVYGLGVLLFAIKFMSIIWGMARKVRNNPKLKIDSIINVLLGDAVVPHTFLNYIFLNREKFEANEIPKDVLVHEVTHAHQKHSLDVLFVELLQIVFWFNPLIHLAKGLIKLNHEFLADEAVLDQGASTPTYQNTLLAFASSAEYKKHQPSMANAINYSSYSSIKKRFKVMKTRTSKKSILVRSILILPLFALLLYGFSTTIEIPKELETGVTIQEGVTKKQLGEYNKLAKKYNAIPKQERVIPLGDLKNLEVIYRKMSEQQKTDALPFPECPDPKTSEQEGATKKQVGEYNTLAKNYNQMLAADGNIRIKKSEVDRLEYLYGLMTENQRADAESFPDFPEPPEPPEPPTPAAAPNERMVEANVAVNEQIVQEIIENQDIYDELGNIWLKPNTQEKKHSANRFYAPTPPNPPTPKTPLDFIKKVTEKNARFYYEGEEINSAKAIEVMKKDPNININTQEENGKRPVVKLAIEPIEIDK